MCAQLTNRSGGTRGLLVAMVTAAVGAAAPMAHAQRGHGGGGGGQAGGNNNQGGVPVVARPASFGGVPAQAPPRIYNMSGVPAQTAPRIDNMSGVRMSFPQVQPLGPALHQPQYRPIDNQYRPLVYPPTDNQYKPLNYGPWPGTVITPPTPTPHDGGGHGGDGHGGGGGHGHGAGGDHGGQGGGWHGGGNGGGNWQGGGNGGDHSDYHGRVMVVPWDGDHYNVNAAYYGDGWKLHVHLGLNDCGLVVPAGHHYHSDFYSPFVYSSWWPWGYGYYGLYNGYYNEGYPTVQGSYTEPAPTTQQPAPAPATQPATPAQPVSHRDVGDLYLRSGDARNAAAAYREHLRANPKDGGAMRALGMSLFALGQTKEAVATIGMAYRTDPGLPESRFPADLLAGGGEELRTDVQKASVYANKSNGAWEWLTVAVLMQAQGRDDLAAKMLKRAEAAGLDASVAARMRVALNH